MSQPLRTRNPWPIAITVVLILFLAGLVTFVTFAVRQKTDLVRPDYYEEELRHQRQMDRLGRTQPVLKQVSVAYDHERQRITVTVPAAHVRPQTTGRIHFYRPSDASLDLTMPLAVDAQGVQHVDTAPLRAGLWKVRLSWRADGQEFCFDQAVVVGPRAP